MSYICRSRQLIMPVEDVAPSTLLRSYSRTLGVLIDIYALFYKGMRGSLSYIDLGH